MLLYNDRVRLTDKFFEWASNCNLPNRPLDVIIFLTANGLLNENKVKKLLKGDKDEQSCQRRS